MKNNVDKNTRDKVTWTRGHTQLPHKRSIFATTKWQYIQIKTNGMEPIRMKQLV